MITQTTLNGDISAAAIHVESACVRAAQNVRALMQEIHSRFVVQPNFARLRDSLRCLPVPSQELAWLDARSHNAEVNHIRGEAEASTYELGLILRHLYRENDERK